MPSETQSFSSVLSLRSLFLAVVATAIIGVLLLAVKALNTGSYDWKPLEIPLSGEPGGQASVTFVPEQDSAHEVVLEFSSILPEPEMRRLLGAGGDHAATDLSWTISSGGQIAAAGGSRILLYYTTGGRTLLGQVKRYLLSIPFHRGTGSLAQVIGRFPSRPGGSTRSLSNCTAMNPALNGASPRFGLKLSRELWLQHEKDTIAFAHGGIVMIGLSALLFAVWLGVVCLRRLMPGPGRR